MSSNPSVVGQRKSSSLGQNNGYKSSNGQRNEGFSEGFIGVLEVFIHQARDIHNICIYHKQDVYAKIFLTSDPETTVSTRTINGGGQNPVFNESLRINVRTGDSSLRCEIWMLSRARNYLEDQLLGFAMVPLCDVLIENVKLEKEFELSTSDLFHSPSGFVKLSVKYTGLSPDVLGIPAPISCLCYQDSNELNGSPCELEKIEFPDPKIVNENEIMVLEYYSSAEIESQSLKSFQATENDDCLSSDSKISRFSKENLETIVVPDVVAPSNNDFKPLDEKKDGVDPLAKPFISVEVEPEQKVVQQEIVDMYMKSMKQFTEALAKMKLPMDNGNKPLDSENVDSPKSNGKGSKGEGPSPKVFYGSRAFF